jgi:hypothetical protein
MPSFREVANQMQSDVKTFAVDPTTDKIFIDNHGFDTGRGVTPFTMNTMPAGLTSGTKVYAIVVDADSIKVASSIANALAGTAIDITTAGSGTFYMYQDVAVWKDIVAAAIAKSGWDVFSGALTLATVNASTATRTITQAQLDEWARRAITSPESMTRNMLAGITAHANYGNNGVAMSDGALTAAINDGIKTIANY